MARTARKEAKVKTSCRIRILARTLFVGIVVRKGHLSTECWSTPKIQSGSGGSQNKGGEGKPKNGTGKAAGSLEHGDQAAVVEPQPQPALASSLDLALFETPDRSLRLDTEDWLRWTCDTGAAISAFPVDAKIGTETQAKKCSYKTASAACACRERLSMGME